MKLFESDIIEAIFELVANTEYKQDAEVLLAQFRALDTNFELDKDDAKITITDNENKCCFEISVRKTHQF